MISLHAKFDDTYMQMYIVKISSKQKEEVSGPSEVPHGESFIKWVKRSLTF